MSEIKSYVIVYFNGANIINVNRDPLTVQGGFSIDAMVNPPENKELITDLVWDESKGYHPLSKGVLTLKGMSPILFDESKYDDWVKPYVDIWQAEKDRLEQEQIEAEQEYAKFENRKERALDTIVEDYHSALAKGFVRTSMGFDADISPDSVATLSATNLALTKNLLAEETPKTVFRDYYGLKRELDKVQVELLICQINLAQNHIRELKYTFKDKVKNTGDNDGLNLALEECVYSTLDFSQNANGDVLPFAQTYSIIDRIDARYR